MSLYELRDLSRMYASPGGETQLALQALSLDIRPGERVALVGPSGSGKSTLLRLLNATLRPTGGSLSYDGRPVWDRQARDLRRMRSRIGSVHQHLGLVPPLLVYENVLTGKLGSWNVLRAILERSFPSRETVREIRALLESLGIGHKWDAITRSLSGGEQQRVAIARLLFQDPDVMLLDEPVSALDPGLAVEAVRRLVAVHQERSRTLVASLHDVSLAREYFPRLVGLKRGRLLFDLPSDQVGDDRLAELYRVDDSEQDGSTPTPRVKAPVHG